MIEIKIMVLGDVHGQTKWLVDRIKFAKKVGADKILQVGDFGLWTHEAEGHRFLDAANEVLRNNGLKLYFVGGNHENWDHLDWHEKCGAKDFNGHVFIRSHILYTGRENRWIWDGKTFQAVGGAYSIDRNLRTVSKDLWLQEEVPERVVWKIENVGLQSDYLFTHDSPSCVPYGNLKPDAQSTVHRALMDRIGKVTRPNLWFHGHYHKWMEYSFMHQQGYSTVYGLDRDFQFYSHVILDTNSNQITLANGKSQ